ncbi:MAG: TetR/AcrR family transcriptional regulator [Cyanobacteria bacterium P01_H01_bin.153]
MASSSRERLVQAALTLFLSQGVSQTTTRQIADLAGVNEVTLFRNFGNKYGLLQAVIQAAPTFRDLGEGLMQQTWAAGDRRQALKEYASECLSALEQAPAFVRSLIGEADQYPAENRQALGQRIAEASHYVARYLAQAMPASAVSSERLSGFLGALLVGYVVIESSSDDHHLWSDREDFLDNLVGLLWESTMKADDTVITTTPLLANGVQDLPAPVVHAILQAAKAANSQDYAIAYVLFGAGLEPTEIVGLERSHHLSAKTQHTLQVSDRQVAVNQWIWGKRYGSYTSNPLTKWLKSRKDDQSSLFIQAADEAAPVSLSIEAIQQKWSVWVQGSPPAQISHPRQAKQTWCVEMLTRGMTVDNLSILSGFTPEELTPYIQRAREKAALEQARQLDQK